MTLGREGDLKGKRILVTAGGTQEPMDPVRYITNRSSGKMGYEIAEAARNRGAHVILITAPTNLKPPYGVEVIRVRRACEMKDKVLELEKNVDAVIMAAAVSDYSPKEIREEKIKREERLILELEKTPDIIGEVEGPLKIGFALETHDLEENARKKLREKKLDLIVANEVSEVSGFEVDTNKITIIRKDGEIKRYPVLPKKEVAHIILDALREEI